MLAAADFSLSLISLMCDIMNVVFYGASRVRAVRGGLCLCCEIVGEGVARFSIGIKKPAEAGFLDAQIKKQLVLLQPAYLSGRELRRKIQFGLLSDF